MSMNGFSKRKADVIAKRIAKILFTSGDGTLCAQLALIETIGDKMNKGGWGQNALADVIYREIVSTPSPERSER